MWYIQKVTDTKNYLCMYDDSDHTSGNNEPNQQ